jgi:phosphate transport system permease protein
VHPSVVELVDNIRLTSVDQVSVDALFSGSLTNWEEIGGQRLPIVIVQPDDLSVIPGAVALLSYAEAERLAYSTLKVNAISRSRNLRLAYLFDSPVESGKYGGISTIIGNTLLMVFFTILIAGPLGIGAATFLVEYPHNKRLLSIIRSGVDVLSGIPSIIFGLFGLLVFVQLLGWSFSLASGSLTIAIMILPTIIRTSEEAIRSVPRSLIEASIALGATKIETIWKVVLPTASPGITTGIILAIGRAVGETAALIYTIGSSTGFASGPLDSARVLAMHIFLTITEGQSLDRAFASALVLVVLVLFINILARFSARRLLKHGK